MKVGVLSDIHGNDAALEVVLADARSMGVEHLLILGDIVGYYYHPDKVLEQLQGWTYDMIQGNHEQMMMQSIDNEGYLAQVTREYGSGVKNALECLTKEQVQYLCQLPVSQNIVLDNVRFGLYHGSPRDTDEYVYPDTESKTLRALSSTGDDYVLMGHTHHPMCAHIGEIVFVNPGSVGQPRDIGGLASWVMINTANRMVVQRRAKFSIDDLIEECKENDPDVPYLREILIRDVRR